MMRGMTGLHSVTAERQLIVWIWRSVCSVCLTLYLVDGVFWAVNYPAYDAEDGNARNTIERFWRTTVSTHMLHRLALHLNALRSTSGISELRLKLLSRCLGALTK